MRKAAVMKCSVLCKEERKGEKLVETICCLCGMWFNVLFSKITASFVKINAERCLFIFFSALLLSCCTG